MPIKRFTPAYDLACESAKNFKFALDWHQYLTDKIAIKTVLSSPDGPAAAHGPRLDTLRSKLTETLKKVGGQTTEGDVLLQMAGVKSGTTLTDAQADALATLKMLRHLYFQRDKGNQSVWIYAQPYSFHQWVFDELKGCSFDDARKKLNFADEVYPALIRGHMVTGLATSLAWCQKCVAKLGGTLDASTKTVLTRWFIPGTAAESDITAVATTLLDGLKKIAALCNSTQVIFSDEPINRMTGSNVSGQTHYRGEWEDYAFVDGGKPRERLDVVYIQNATLQKWSSANQGWMATLAIIHELSHRVINTKDAVYDYTGLKPGAVLQMQHALANADSWAYFVADLNGQLPSNKVTSVMKEPAALRAAYLASLASP